MVNSSGLSKSIIKSHAEEKGWVLPWARRDTKIWGFPFNIYTMAEARDFKFGKQLRFAKTHHKTTPRGNEGVALGYGSSHIFGVPLYYFCRGRADLLALA